MKDHLRNQIIGVDAAKGKDTTALTVLKRNKDGTMEPLEIIRNESKIQEILNKFKSRQCVLSCELMNIL